MAKDGGPRGAKGRTPTGARAELKRGRRRERTPRTQARKKRPQPTKPDEKPKDLGGPADGSVRSQLPAGVRDADGTIRRSSPAGIPSALRVIEPPSPGVAGYVKDVWRHRTAFLYFMRRYMRKRYGRTFLGYIWLFLPVILPLFLGALVFGGILGVTVPGVPYFLYFCVALGAWLLFSQTAYFSTRSLEISRSDIRRVYIPRIIPLMSAMTLPAITMLIYVFLTAGTVGFYVLTRGEFYLALRPATLLVPCGLLMLLVFGWACGLWFSPLAPRARDVRRLAGYVIGFWYFLTPVMYPIDEIPSGFQFLASLNPVTAPLEMVKSGLLDVGDVTSLGLATYVAALVVLSGVGMYIFVRKERRDMAFY